MSTIYELTEQERAVMKKLIDNGLVVTIGEHAKFKRLYQGTEFPKQGAFLGKKVCVCFNYDPEIQFPGVVVRDDAEEPGRMIIRLDDGRYVLSTECQYKLK